MILGVNGPLFGGVAATFNLDDEFQAKGAHKISRKMLIKIFPINAPRPLFVQLFKLQVIMNFLPGKRL